MNDERSHFYCGFADRNVFFKTTLVALKFDARILFYFKKKLNKIKKNK